MYRTLPRQEALAGEGVFSWVTPNYVQDLQRSFDLSCFKMRNTREINSVNIP